VGTPPNLMGLAFIQRFLHYDFTFMRWVLLAAPLVLLLYLYLFAVLNFGSHSAKVEVPHPTPDRSSFSRAQRSTVFAWSVTLVLWVTPGLVAIAFGDKHPAAVWMLKLFPESIAALIGVALLLSLPGTGGQRALPFRDAFIIDWEVILLYASGFALGVAASQTGLANSVGQSLAAQVPPVSPYLFLLGTTFAAAIVSEFASNTSSANIVVPVAISIAQSAGYDPLPPAIAATFGSTLGFMLPISTPCNAIVYASGYIPLSKMIRYGIALDLVGAVVIATGVHFLFPYLR
jgi:solute carrier family 13 (sodium-dependent dicarboxylate transporter), member 2/3/5